MLELFGDSSKDRCKTIENWITLVDKRQTEKNHNKKKRFYVQLHIVF